MATCFRPNILPTSPEFVNGVMGAGVERGYFPVHRAGSRRVPPDFGTSDSFLRRDALDADGRGDAVEFTMNRALSIMDKAA